MDPRTVRVVRPNQVWVDVTAAKAGVREAILVNILSDGAMNPAEAAQLGAAIAVAAELVNQLCPPLSIDRGMSTPPASCTPEGRPYGGLVDVDQCAAAGHCVKQEEVCSIDARHGDHQPTCCSCGENLPVVAS